MKAMLGILGGMGPIASAEFIKTIYELQANTVEQKMPACLLYSDPGMPDRTDAILTGNCAILQSQIHNAFETLLYMGATKLVMLCVTAHFLFYDMPSPLRQHAISLVDLILEEVVDSQKEHILLCTNGSRASGVFQMHPLWNRASDLIKFPSEADQIDIHDMIYRLKNNPCNFCVGYERELVKKYDVEGWIAGCTELHLISKNRGTLNSQSSSVTCIDPLITIARSMDRFLGETSNARKD